MGPINKTWKVGLGITTPFGLTTEWENPTTFAGRFLSTKAALRAFDFNRPSAGRSLPSFGIGFGAIMRYSESSWSVRGANNPFTQSFVNVGKLD